MQSKCCIEPIDLGARRALQVLFTGIVYSQCYSHRVNSKSGHKIKCFQNLHILCILYMYKDVLLDFQLSILKFIHGDTAIPILRQASAELLPPTIY